jgi:inner membrane protease ATP23
MSKPEQPTDGPAPTEPTKTPAQIDPVFYNWSNTFTILLSRMNGARDPTLETNYFREQDAINGDRYCKRCETSRDYLLQYSPVIRFLSDEVGKLGGDLNKNNIHCRLCTNEQSGGFHIDHGILLCANKFRNRGHQEDTMAHEMVHAWDHLKWKVEDDNLKHQACLEVRSLLMPYNGCTCADICRFGRRRCLESADSRVNSSHETNGGLQSSCRVV